MKYFNINYLSSALVGILALTSKANTEKCLQDCDYCNAPETYSGFETAHTIGDLFNTPVTFEGEEYICMPWYINNCEDASYLDHTREPSPYVLATNLYYDNHVRFNMSVLYESLPSVSKALPNLYDYKPSYPLTHVRMRTIPITQARKFVTGLLYSAQNQNITIEDLKLTGRCTSQKVCFQNALQMLISQSQCGTKSSLHCYYWPTINSTIITKQESLVWNATLEQDVPISIDVESITEVPNPNCAISRSTPTSLFTIAEESYYVIMDPVTTYQHPKLYAQTCASMAAQSQENPNATDSHPACSMLITNALVNQLHQGCSKIGIMLATTVLSILLGFGLGVLSVICYARKCYPQTVAEVRESLRNIIRPLIPQRFREPKPSLPPKDYAAVSTTMELRPIRKHISAPIVQQTSSTYQIDIDTAPSCSRLSGEGVQFADEDSIHNLDL